MGKMWQCRDRNG